MNTQAKIFHYQALYREWLALQTDHQKFMANLIYQNAIADALFTFYFNDHGQSEWQTIYEQIENGLGFDLTTDGEYSVMNQDTLWDMFYDEQEFYENLIQFAQKRLNTLNKN